MTLAKHQPESGRLQRVLNSQLLQNLTTPHGVDAYLQAINPLWAANEVRARLTAILQQTPDTVTVSLKPNSNWQGFLPGQYLRLTVEVNGVSHTRCFSPANSIYATGEIELTCKVNDDSQVSRFLRDTASEGLVVSLSQAEGQFALPATRPDRIVLISGGSGITPVMSMLRSLCDENYPGQITFLHYCNNSSALLYADELAEIAAKHTNVALLRCFAEADQGGELEGLFSAQQLQDAVPDFAQAESFLCGPPGLMERVSAAYEHADAENRLHQEHFVAAVSHDIDPDTVGGEVRFKQSERLTENSGDTLLNQAEAAGLKPASGCRMGICYACTCRKTAGQVRDIRNGQISAAGEEEIQLCVSVPVGTVEIDL